MRGEPSCPPTLVADRAGPVLYDGDAEAGAIGPVTEVAGVVSRANGELVPMPRRQPGRVRRRQQTGWRDVDEVTGVRPQPHFVLRHTAPVQPRPCERRTQPVAVQSSVDPRMRVDADRR